MISNKLRKIDIIFLNNYLYFIEKFFEMKKGQCKDALEIYKRFLTRMTRVSEFLKVAEVSNKKPFWKCNTQVSEVNNEFIIWQAMLVTVYEDRKLH